MKNVFKSKQQFLNAINCLDTNNSANSSTNNNCQLLRSGSKWSIGLENKTEHSIYNAYLS